MDDDLENFRTRDAKQADLEPYGHVNEDISLPRTELRKYPTQRVTNQMRITNPVLLYFNTLLSDISIPIGQS